MKKEKIAILSYISIGVLLRIVPHPANVAPIAAMALFGGVYLNKRFALIVPVITMLLSDTLLGFHTTMLFVYGSFLITGLIGLWLRRHKTRRNILLGTLFSSFLFFLMTNFGVWLMGGMYPKTIHGLLESYVMGLPFFRNTLIGDFMYTGLLFGAYETAKSILIQKKVRST